MASLAVLRNAASINLTGTSIPDGSIVGDWIDCAGFIVTGLALQYDETGGGLTQLTSWRLDVKVGGQTTVYDVVGPTGTDSVMATAVTATSNKFFPLWYPSAVSVVAGMGISGVDAIRAACVVATTGTNGGLAGDILRFDFTGHRVT